MDYAIHVAILVGIYFLAAVGLNLVSGYAGLVSLAQASFFGIGAYSFAVFTQRFEIPFAISITLSMSTAAFLASILSLLCSKQSQDILIMTTFAFQSVMSNIMLNWDRVTNGAVGISGIPGPHLLGYDFTSGLGFLVLLLAFASLGILLKYRLVSSPFGMIALAIREDETLTTATGRNVAAKKAVIFGIGAAYGALAGSLYASYITFIDPSTFTVTESVFILAIVILGGAGKLWGPLIGAAVMVTFPEMLRLTGIPGHLVGNLRQIMLGAVIVFLMLTRPQGLIGDFVFGGASKRGKSVDR